MTEALPSLILPGLMCDGRMFPWRPAVEGSRVANGYYGGADRLEAMAAWVLASAPPQFGLIGHSMGARVALEVVRLAPERVASLVLANTGIHRASAAESDKRYSLRDLGRRHGFAALADEWLPPMVAPRNRSPHLMARLRGMVMDAGQSVFEAQTEALLSRPDVGGVVGMLKCPVLVMTGDCDTWSPPAQHELIAARIPGSCLKVLRGAGHMLPAEDPEGFGNAIEQWIASLA